jgi:hypothetical protein
VLARKSPIKEGTMNTLVNNLKCRNLTHLDIRLLGGCHKTVLRIVVNEYLNLITLLHIEACETIREQHLVALIILKI